MAKILTTIQSSEQKIPLIFSIYCPLKMREQCGTRTRSEILIETSAGQAAAAIFREA